MESKEREAEEIQRAEETEQMGAGQSRQTNKELTAALEAKNNSISVANRNLAELNDRDKVLCAKVKSVEKLNSDLTSHLEGARAANEHLEKEVRIKRQNNSALAKECKEAVNGEEAWREKAQRAGEEQLRVENIVEERNAEIDSIMSISTTNNQHILDLEETIKTTQNRNEQLEAKVRVLTKRLGRKVAQELMVGDRVRDEESGTVFTQGDVEAVVQSPTIIHKWESGESPVGVKLIKNTKGYVWEISIKAKDPEEMMRELRKVEAEVRAEYGTPSE